MERSAWTLLAVSYAKDRALTPVQIQKVLFILGKELPAQVGPNYYAFTPYNYGPFDKAVYADAANLSEKGFVHIADSGQGFKEYSPTPEGLRVSALIAEQAPPRGVAYLQSLVQWAQGLSFADLVRAVYAKYPDTRVNSVFQG